MGMNEFDREYLDHICMLTKHQYLVGLLVSAMIPLAAVILAGDLRFISLVPIALIMSMSPKRMLRKGQSEAVAVLICLSDNVKDLLNRLLAVALKRNISKQLVALAVLASAYVTIGGNNLEPSDALYSFLLMIFALIIYALEWMVYSHTGAVIFQTFEIGSIAAVCMLPVAFQVFDPALATAVIVCLCALLLMMAGYLAMNLKVNTEGLLDVI